MSTPETNPAPAELPAPIPPSADTFTDRLAALESEFKLARQAIQRFQRRPAIERSLTAASAADLPAAAELVERLIDEGITPDIPTAIRKLAGQRPDLFHPAHTRRAASPASAMGPAASPADTAPPPNRAITDGAARGDRRCLTEFLRSRRA